jgi:hypothetical protein
VPKGGRHLHVSRTVCPQCDAVKERIGEELVVPPELFAAEDCAHHRAVVGVGKPNDVGLASKELVGGEAVVGEVRIVKAEHVDNA